MGDYAQAAKYYDLLYSGIKDYNAESRDIAAWISTTTGSADDLHVCRMSRTTIDGTTSTLEFEYLIGAPDGIERRSERHALGLFTREQMESAFVNAGLSVEQRKGAPRNRGVYVGRPSVNADAHRGSENTA